MSSDDLRQVTVGHIGEAKVERLELGAFGEHILPRKG